VTKDSHERIPWYERRHFKFDCLSVGEPSSEQCDSECCLSSFNLNLIRFDVGGVELAHEQF